MVQAPRPVRCSQAACRSWNHSGGLSSRWPGARSCDFDEPESAGAFRSASSIGRGYHRAGGAIPGLEGWVLSGMIQELAVHNFDWVVWVWRSLTGGGVGTV